MTTLVDSNVLLDLFTADPAWPEWSRDAILTALRSGTLAINPIVYAKLSAAFAHERELENELDRLDVERRARGAGRGDRIVVTRRTGSVVRTGSGKPRTAREPAWNSGATTAQPLILPRMSPLVKYFWRNG